MDYSAEEQDEISKNRTGKIIWLASIVFIIIASFGLNAGSGAAICGVTGVVGFIAGFFMTMGNRSKSQIDEQHRNAKIQAELMIKMAKAGVSPVDIANRVSSMNTPKHTSTSGTKEIIKGAVIGGIVAGDAGAVVGATVAKNKLDNERKNKHK